MQKNHLFKEFHMSMCKQLWILSSCTVKGEIQKFS